MLTEYQQRLWIGRCNRIIRFCSRTLDHIEVLGPLEKFTTLEGQYTSSEAIVDKDFTRIPPTGAELLTSFLKMNK